MRRNSKPFFAIAPCTMVFTSLAAEVSVDPDENGLAGSAWPRHVIDATSEGADGVRLGDVNGDGRTDVVTGWEEGGLVRVYTHPGDAGVRNPWPFQTVGKVESPEDAVLVDLDGDQRLDVVSACEGATKTLFFHWAPVAPGEDWRTEAIPAPAHRQAWMYILAVDMDGQHGIDLLVGSKGPGAAIGWLASPADPRQAADWQYHHLREAGWIMSLESADVDGDGDEDIVFSDRRGERSGVYWLERGQAWREHPIGSLGDEAMFLDVHDLDQDARPEVMVAVKKRSLRIFSSRGEGHWEATTLEMPERVLGTAKAVRAGDLDGDGDADLVCSCEGAEGERSGVAWVENRGEFPWLFHEVSGATGIKFDHLKLLDLDADGDLDVLTCEERTGLGVIWYENRQR